MAKKILSLSLAVMMLVVMLAFAPAGASAAEAEYAFVVDADVVGATVDENGVSGTASLTIANNSGAAASAKVITAIYDSATKELLNVGVTNNVEIPEAGAEVEVTVPATSVAGADNCIARFYLWENTTLAPLAAVEIANIRDVWDGTANDEPALIDGVYQISNAEELAWFSNYVANIAFSAPTRIAFNYSEGASNAENYSLAKAGKYYAPKAGSSAYVAATNEYGATFTAITPAGGYDAEGNEVEGGTYSLAAVDTYYYTGVSVVGYGLYNIYDGRDIDAVLVNDIYLNNFADEQGLTDKNWYEKAENVAKAKNWKSFQIGRTLTSETEGKSRGFGGTFDGNGKSVYGMYVVDSTTSIGGLFSIINSGTVKNLKVEDAYVVSKSTKAQYGSGGASVIAHQVIGTSNSARGVIDGVTASGLITVAKDKKYYLDFAGSIVAHLDEFGTVKNCTSNVNIIVDNPKTTLPDVSKSNLQGIGGIVGGTKLTHSIRQATEILDNTNNGNIYAPSSNLAAGIIAFRAANTNGRISGNTNNGRIESGLHAMQILARTQGSNVTSEHSGNTANGSASVITAE